MPRVFCHYVLSKYDPDWIARQLGDESWKFVSSSELKYKESIFEGEIHCQGIHFRLLVSPPAEGSPRRVQSPANDKYSLLLMYERPLFFFRRNIRRSQFHDIVNRIKNKILTELHAEEWKVAIHINEGPESRGKDSVDERKKGKTTNVSCLFV